MLNVRQWILDRDRLVFWCVMLFLLSGNLHAEESVSKRLLDPSNYTPDQEAALLRGEVLVYDTGDEFSSDVTGSDLYSGLVSFVPQTMPSVVKVLQELSTSMLRDKTIMDLSPGSAFPLIRFAAADSKEIERILSFETGRDINLASDELSKLQGLGISTPFDADERAAFSNAYRSLLERRFHDYRKGWLSGIKPYTRGKDKLQDIGKHLLAVRDI